MSNEIQFYDPSLSGKTLYAVLRDPFTGGVRNVVASGWDTTPTAAEIDNYDIALAEQSTLGLFYANRPGALNPKSLYFITIHRRMGGSPAATDPIVGSGAIGDASNVEAWMGSSVQPPSLGGHILCDVSTWQGDAVPVLSNGCVPASVQECAAGAIDAAALAAGAVGASQLAADAVAEIAAGVLAVPANKLATDASGRVTVGANADKTGYSLAATGLDSIVIDGQTLVAAFQIVLAALSGNVSSGGGGDSGSYVVNLTTARNNLAARLAEITAAPKPSYSIDGQSVSWTEYQRLLLEQLTRIDEQISGAEPFEDQSQAFT